MLSSELELCLNAAFQSARERRHEFITVEHLLLALMDIPQVQEILTACGGSVDELRGQLTGFIDTESPLLVAENDSEVQPTLGFQRVLQRAVFRVQASGKNEVVGADVLVAIFSEKQSRAVHFLGLQSISRLDVVNHIACCTLLGSEENGNEEPPVPRYQTSMEGSLDRLVGTQIATGKRLDRIEVQLDEIQRLLAEKGHRKDEQ